MTTDNYSLTSKLKEGIIKYNKSAVEFAAKEIIKTDIDVSKAILDGLVAGMKVLSQLYEEKKIFLPELLIGTEAFYTGLEILKGRLSSKDLISPKVGEVVIGTVEGDIHDMGKNIVKVVMETSGFVVHDLGASVPKEKFIEMQIKTGSDVIALSTMMTTTMMEMKKIIKLVRENELDTKVIIGGAAITPEVARKFEADGYAPNAVAAARESLKLIKKLVRP